MNSASAAFLVITLNNEGLKFLEEEKYEKAVGNLTRALGIVRGQLSDCCKCQTKAFTPSFTFQDASPVVFFCETLKNGQGLSSLSTFSAAAADAGDRMDLEEIVSANGNDAGFVFKKPIAIAPPSCVNYQGSYRYYVSLSFIMLFNLALAHHLFALDMNCETRLRKALTLYELAYTVQIREDINLTALQTMAIVNNLGMIHRDLRDAEHSRQCFEHLLCTVMYVQISQDEEACRQIHNFIANLMPIIFPHPDPAAAA